MKSTIRAWNCDAGTYGAILLTLYAPDTGDSAQDELDLWDCMCKVAPLMGRSVAVFFGDRTVPEWTESNYGRRRAA